MKTQPDDLSTENYAEMIAESLENGQRKQAITQFKRAVNDHCNAKSLCDDILYQGADSNDVILLLCAIAEGK